MTRYLIALLFAASAFGAAAPKPPAADDIRNVHGPRPDMLAVAWALNENTGTTATNVGKRSSYNGTLASAAWTSNADGVYANAIVRGPDSSGTTYYPRGTILLYANAGASASALRIVASTETGTFPPENPYEFQVGIVANADTVRLGYVNSAGAIQTVNAVANYDITATSWVPIVVRFGERGLKIDTLGATQGTNAATTGLAFRNGTNLILNANSEATSAGQRVHILAWWDVQLEDFEIRELLADPYLPVRPNCAEGGLYQVMHTANPIVGRPGEDGTSLTWQVGAPPAGDYDTYTKEFDWRIAYTRADASTPAAITSNGVLDLSAATATAWSEVRVADAGLPKRIMVTGLTPGTLYVWQAQYREDDGTVHAFPGGIGYATTRRASGAFNFVTTTDCHQGLIASSVGTYAVGVDVTSNGTADFAMRRGFASARDLHKWCFTNGCDFIIDAGDATMGLARDGWSASMNDVFKSGAYFQVYGNHEKTLGAYLEADDEEANRTVYGLVYNRLLTCNPDASTYTQGGESEGCPQDPYAGANGDPYCSNVSWVPGAASCDDDFQTTDTAWDTNAEAETQAQAYLEFNGAGSTWAEKLGALEPACSNGLGNYYGFTWGDASFWILDPYTYTAVADTLQSTVRLSADDWTYGPVQQAWLEAGLAADTKSWKFVIQHMLPGGLEGGSNGTEEGKFYGRGSGATITTAAERWYWDTLRAYGAIGIKGHDHGWAHVEQAGVQQFTAGNFGHSSRFIGDSYRWTYPLDYGDPSMQGANAERVVNIRPQWGWGHITITDANTATWTYRQTVVDQADIDDQTTPDTWTSSYRMSGEVGEVLTVDADGNVTLTETPNDVLVLCDADDGDFLQYGWDAAIADTNWGGANDYSMTIQDWGTNGSKHATIAVPAFAEPHADAVIATGKAAGTKVRVHYAPRDLYTTTLHRAVKNPTYVPLDGTVRGSAGLHYRGE